MDELVNANEIDDSAATTATELQPGSQSGTALMHARSAPFSSLPKLKDGQIWCCVEGCGECTPRLLDRRLTRYAVPDGGTEEKRAVCFVSGCCSAPMFVFDVHSGCQVDLEEDADLVYWCSAARGKPSMTRTIDGKAAQEGLLTTQATACLNIGKD